MTAQINKDVTPYSAMRGEPIFNIDQERVATLLTLIPQDVAESEQITSSRADAYRRLYEGDLERLFGNTPLVLGFPAHEADTVLDIPWPRERVIAYQTVAPHTDVVTPQDRIWERGLPFVIDASLHEALPDDKPQPRFLAIPAQENLPEPAPNNASIPIWLTDIDSRSILENTATGRNVEWISGRFWKTPNLQPGRAIPAGRLGALKLLAELQNPNVSIDEIESIINCDTTLSYKLLRLLNSAFFSSPGRVDSIRNGVNFFGLQRIKNWATVIVMNSVDFKPRDILPLGAYRARLAEMLAGALRHKQPQDYYLVGLFSILDALFSSTMEELIAPLHLQQSAFDALVSESGATGEVLAWMRATEEGRHFTAPSLGGLSGIDILELQIQALAWTNEFCRSLRG